MKFLTPAKQPEAKALPQKRRYERRTMDQCVAEISGKTFPVVNWSQGGALVFVDDRMFGKEERLEVTLKFHLQDRIVPIQNKAKVLRKGFGRMAVQFDSVNDDSRRAYQQIIDDITTRAFADSQA
ncbi:MAG: PilZ domain-containing protein [Rhodospirillales bacterium]|nr:PilZ domain-containing protein [Rhodospirillales bacterium]MCB9965719.1 PilZ domain-containing protein [Rhodospirillales bacterium]MCB9980078.1 PilZ domain-containing protein [Rhodospirillales bacterium]